MVAIATYQHPVTVFYDWRVDCPEIVIGLSGAQIEKEDQVPIEIVAKQKHADLRNHETGAGKSAAFEQIKYELGWLAQNAQNLLEGNRPSFEQLRHYYAGYCAAYTDYCSGEFDSD